MEATLTQLLGKTIEPEMVMSAFSAAFTGYFWLIKVRKEKPALTIIQLRNFRTSLRTAQNGSGGKRLGLTQVEPCGILVANNSIRQNAIIGFDCFLKYKGETIKGDWGYVNDDTPPWNIGPESAISLSLACFFDVPDHCELPEDLNFRVEFKTASGKRFPHLFSIKAPEL